jgi:hypothetical protein
VDRIRLLTGHLSDAADDLAKRQAEAGLPDPARNQTQSRIMRPEQDSNLRPTA